jgi:tRNA(Arg) A34 adenosine deaminase TadA
MCLGAILWSRISRIYYGFSITDAATIGFDDREFYRQFSLPAAERKVPCRQLAPEEAKELLGEYAGLPGRVAY